MHREPGESRGGISPPRAPRTVHEPLDSHGSRCSAVAISRTALPCPRAPPVTGWPGGVAEQRSPFGPAPLQSLRPYYELLRPCAPHRYSGPCGFSRLDASLYIGATGSQRSVQEPDPASRRLHAGCRPGTLQANPRAYPGSSTLLRFRHPLWHFDTSSAVRFRSPLRTIPDGISSRLLLQRSPQPLLTIAACSGLRPAPDCRPRGAFPHLLYSSTPSFTEAVFVTHHRVRP